MLLIANALIAQFINNAAGLKCSYILLNVHSDTEPPLSGNDVPLGFVLMISDFQIAAKKPRVQIIFKGLNITLKKPRCNPYLVLCPIVPYYQYKTAKTSPQNQTQNHRIRTVLIDYSYKEADEKPLKRSSAK